MKSRPVRYPGTTIIAIGGGGFTHGTDSALEHFILEQCRKTRPRIGYIGAANEDDAGRIDLFYQRFSSLGASSHLLQKESVSTASAWIIEQDIIYVAGGNTADLIRFLQNTGLDGPLLKAAQGGTILAGVSAGAVCWFEFALSDSRGHGLEVLPGLGLIRGSCCPHYSSEAGRRPVFEKQIAARILPTGIAIDDGVAVLLRHRQSPLAFAAREGKGAYLVYQLSDESMVIPLETVN